jgi:hypothetical protein
MHINNNLLKLARPAGLEPATHSLEVPELFNHFNGWLAE